MAHLFKRGRIYYLKYYVGKKQKQFSLRTGVSQIAKEKKRQFESAQACGLDNPLPTRTPLDHILGAYVDHIRAVKTAKSAQTEIYYLRESFGSACSHLEITSRAPSTKTRKRKPKISRIDSRRKLPVIEANSLEEITTAQIAQFIDFKVRDQGLKPKTVNHYRSILRRLFNWAVEQHGIKLPNNTNPAAKVRPYKEQAPEIRFLTLPQIDDQLHALSSKPQLQAMTAVLIYAGLRREELLWLTQDDVALHHKTRRGVIRIRAKTIGDRFWQPKTKTNRVVPISTSLYDILLTYQPRRSLMTVGSNWYFPSPEGKWWDPDNFSKRLRKMNSGAGLQWACLDFRHTFGSQLAQKGVSLYKIATLMGNSPEICRRHYAALIPEALTDEVEFSSPGQPKFVA